LDTRFTTVAEDMDELIEALDVDGVADLETLLIVLFGCPISVDETPADDVDDADGGDASFEVIMWDDTMGIGTRYSFPMSLVDLALGCASTFSDMRSAEDDDPDEDSDRPDLLVMDEGELITTLQRALGHVRIFNMLHPDEDA
jgi:hypothetical protein